MSESIKDLFTLEQKHVMFYDKHFELTTQTPMALRYDDCIILMIYDSASSDGVGREDTTANSMKIFIEASKSATNAIFAMIDIATNPDFRAGVNITAMNADNPFHSFAPKRYPAIITYRNHFPKGFYNGSATVEGLVAFSREMACNTNYIEPYQLGFEQTNFLVSTEF